MSRMRNKASVAEVLRGEDGVIKRSHQVTRVIEALVRTLGCTPSVMKVLSCGATGSDLWLRGVFKLLHG